jgi:VCBS repeat-containing protein
MTTIATGLKISIANTPQAKDDVYGSVEDFAQLLDVLCNDLGGNAKTLYSLSKDLTIEDGGSVTSASMIGGTPSQSITTNLGATATIVDGKINYVTNSLDYLGEGETRVDVFSYVIRLSSGAFSIATVSVTVTGSNDIPVATAASTAVSEDSSILGSVAATDADAGETASLTYALVGAAPTGLTFNADGSYSFDASSYDSLVAGEALVLTIPFTASDATSTSAPANLVITVTGTNDVPVAIADTDAVLEDAVILAGSVAATDADAGETASLTYALVGAAPTGLTFNADGSYSFDASSYDSLVAGEALVLTIPFTASDATSTSAPANLVITVTGTNDVPVAIADTDAVLEDAVILAGSVAATDADAGETASLTYALVGAAPTGLTFNADGSYSFDASSYDSLVAGEALVLTIPFTASDATSTSAPANLVITVTGTNDVPVAIADTDAVLEDAVILAGSVAATDADAGETASLTYALVGAAPTGLTFNADGSYSFDASSYDSLVAGEALVLTIPFTASDATSTSAPANLVITVTGTNDVPVAIADTDAVLEDAVILAGSVAATDADAGETASLTYALVGAAPTGLTFNADGSYSFDASSYDSLVAGEALVLTIPFTASDATSTSAPANLVITVTGTNDVPVAIADTDAVLEDAVILAGSVAATDADAGETASLTYALVGAAPTGLTFNADGSYSFDASSYDSLVAGEALVLTIPFTASDATSTSAPANLVITVTGTNDVPVLSDTSNPAPVAELADASAQNLAPILGSFAVTDLDVGDTLDASIVGGAVVLLNGNPFVLPAGASALTAAGAFTVTGTTSNGGAASIAYSYDPGAANLDFLAAGQSLTITYQVKVNDGTADSATQDVTFTITGTVDGISLPTTFTGGADPNDFDSLVGTNTPGFLLVNGTNVGETLTGDTSSNDKDIINGFGGDDTINAGDATDQVYGGTGNDIINGGDNSDLLYGQAGIDTIHGNQIADDIYGGSDGDFLFGDAGADNIYGGSGADSINGGVDNDILIGGYGADQLTGGGGNDTFVYLDLKDTNDTITDFNSGDHIDLSAIDANLALAGDQGFAFGGTTATAHGVWYAQVGGNVVVYVDTDGDSGTAELSITLTGLASVSSGDILGGP